jgi:hypothetical protein
MKKPTIKFQCYNTAEDAKGNTMMDVETWSNEITSSDLTGHAISKPVQFYINQHAVAGTIFVDSKNDGICVAKIVKDPNDKIDYIFTNSEVFIIPENGAYPPNVVKSVGFGKGTPNADQKQLQFNIHRIGTTVGNINLFFKVEYKRIEK